MPSSSKNNKRTYTNPPLFRTTPLLCRRRDFNELLNNGFPCFVNNMNQDRRGSTLYSPRLR